MAEGTAGNGVHFGFRRSELLEMRVHQIDLFNRTIRLYRGETKSGEPRTIKMTEDGTCSCGSV